MALTGVPKNRILGRGDQQALGGPKEEKTRGGPRPNGSLPTPPLKEGNTPQKTGGGNQSPPPVGQPARVKVTAQLCENRGHPLPEHRGKGTLTRPTQTENNRGLNFQVDPYNPRSGIFRLEAVNTKAKLALGHKGPTNAPKINLPGLKHPACTTNWHNSLV